MQHMNIKADFCIFGRDNEITALSSGFVCAGFHLTTLYTTCPLVFDLLHTDVCFIFVFLFTCPK